MKVPKNFPSSENFPKDKTVVELFGKSQRSKKFQIHLQDYHIGIASPLIKKIIIYFLHGLHLFRLYLEIKTKEQYLPFLKEHMSPKVVKHNKELMQNRMADKSYSDTLFKIDFSLLEKSIKQLMNLVDIKLFQEFVSLSQVVFTSERESMSSSVKKNLHLLSENTMFCFESNDYEIDSLLCAKRKRGDEGLKHCFKAIRKGIFNSFKKDKPSNSNLGSLKEEFHTLMFGEEEKLKHHFRENNITKETISNLKMCTAFNTRAEDYKRCEFLKDQVKRNILEKKEEILKDNLSFEGFAKVLLDKQKKHGWILQNIINSIEMYDACTIYLKPRKRKRKLKKKT